VKQRARVSSVGRTTGPLTLQFAQVAVTSLRGAFSGRYHQDEINAAIDQWFHTKLFDLLPADAHNQVKSSRRSSGRLP